MVKAYQRYTPRTIFGVVASGNSNIIYDADGKYAISPALEDISVWDLKKGELVSTSPDCQLFGLWIRNKLMELDQNGRTHFSVFLDDISLGGHLARRRQQS